MAWLTKSRFLSGLQCHKRLWFEVRQPIEESAKPSMAILQGRAFDEVVQSLRPGVVISRERGMPAAIGDQADFGEGRRCGAVSAGVSGGGSGGHCGCVETAGCGVRSRGGQGDYAGE